MSDTPIESLAEVAHEHNEHLVDDVRRVRVSTVLIEPLSVWETMIFGGPLDGFERQYTTALDALIGHAFAVGLVDLFYTAPRKTKKALQKLGARRQRLRSSERRRLWRALKRL